MAAPRPASTRYDTLSVYDRTLIEVTEAIIASNGYAPGPLILELAKDATKVLMGELGFAMPVAGLNYDPYPVEFEVWIKQFH
jgi:hypothetical protein